ncbi:MAG: hypothetical protein ACTSWY_10835 [Promethearchaeota archaeon]
MCKKGNLKQNNMDRIKKRIYFFLPLLNILVKFSKISKGVSTASDNLNIHHYWGGGYFCGYDLFKQAISKLEIAEKP